MIKTVISNLTTDFKWDFETKSVINNDSITIQAMPHSNYFISPETDRCNLNGHFYHMEYEGDFRLRARVKHDFITQYDACCLMAMSGEDCWAKLCFEYTDIGTHSVVSIVTNGVFDDANGIDIDGNGVYLQLSKKGDVFAMHYSLDGTVYKMTRYFRLPSHTVWKVGFVGQSPIGTGGTFSFDEIGFDTAAPIDLRNGN